jgi:hypothetical protein
MRSKEWVYGHSSTHSHLLTSYAKDRGYPSSWGDPQVLSACGGTDADVVWKALGVPGRGGVGGLPCELLHSAVTTRWGLDNSCLTNVGVRFCLAFIEAMALYLPVSVWLGVHCTAPLTMFERSTSFLSSSLALAASSSVIAPSLRSELRSAVRHSSPLSCRHFSPLSVSHVPWCWQNCSHGSLMTYGMGPTAVFSRDHSRVVGVYLLRTRGEGERWPCMCCPGPLRHLCRPSGQQVIMLVRGWLSGKYSARVFSLRC